MRKLHAHSLRTTRKHTQALQPPDINTTQAVRCLPTNARPQLVSRQPQRYCNRPSSARNPCGRTSHNKCASTTGQRATCTQCQCNRSKSAHNPGSASPLSQNRSTTSQHATHHQGYCNRPSSARNPCSGTPHNKMCTNCCSTHIEALGVMILVRAPSHAKTPPPHNQSARNLPPAATQADMH